MLVPPTRSTLHHLDHIWYFFRTGDHSRTW